MKLYLTYFQLEIKRMLRSLPGIILGSILLISLLSGIFWFCHQSSQTPARKKTVSVGIVARKGEPFIDWMIHAVSQMENTKYSCQFLRLSEKKADEQMASGKINVIFLIPENYVASIINGENKHVTIRFPQEQTSIASFLLRELCTAASSFILNSEAGIYTMQDFYRKHNLPDYAEDELSLNISYIKEIATLSDGMDVHEVEIPGKYPQASTYAISGIVLFFFLWGTASGNTLTSQNHAFQQKLRLLSVGYPVQVIIRNIAFFLMNALGFCLLTLAAYLLLKWKSISITDTILAQPEKIWLFSLSLLPVLWLACTLIQCVYEITEDAAGGAIFLFFSVMLLAFLSGCFYPLDHLPLSVRKLAGTLPLLHSIDYGLSCLYGRVSLTPFIWVTGYGIFFISITALWRTAANTTNKHLTEMR